MNKKFFKERLEIGQHNIRLEWKWLKEFGFVPAFLILLGAVVCAIVSIPAIYGVFTIVMGSASPPSPIESMGLALLSTALAGVVFLLVKPWLGSTSGNSSESVARQTRSSAEIMGVFFIVAAIAFALFAMLCPFLGAASEGQRFFPHTAFGDFCEVFVKWTSLLSLLVGTSAFVVSLTLGPFLFASDMLRRKKRT
jgi:hypothetical protein